MVSVDRGENVSVFVIVLAIMRYMVSVLCDGLRWDLMAADALWVMGDIEMCEI
jgi:hypothetical protein